MYVAMRSRRQHRLNNTDETARVEFEGDADADLGWQPALQQSRAEALPRRRFNWRSPLFGPSQH